MRIVINTPNGTIGRRLTEQLLDAGASLTLITRNATKVADFAVRGARVVEGSIDAPEVLTAALDGADQLFWLTPPSYRPDAAAWAAGTARAAAAAARGHGIARVVVLSSTGAHSGPGTGAVGHLLAVEDAFRDAVPNVVVLRAGFLMENLLRDLPSILRDGAIYSPNPGGKPVPMVAAADVAARAAAFLLDGSWSGHRIVGVHGPADLGYAQIAAILSDAFDRPVRHVETTLDHTRTGMLAAGMPDFVVASYIEMFEAIRDGRMDPSEPRSHETYSPTSLHEFATRVLRPALRAASGVPETPDVSLALRANEIMTAWELGDTETYRDHCAPSVRMTIPAYGLDLAGFEAIWGVRTSMKPLDAGPLDIHTVVSHRITGRTVSAISHVISRKTGQLAQHAAVRFEFDDDRRLVHYHQEVVWQG